MTNDIYSSADCYKLTASGSWAKDHKASLNTERFKAAAVVLNNQLVISAGWNGFGLRSLEVASPNERPKTLSVQLPTGINAHCQVAWDSDTVIVIGGWSTTFRAESYFLNIKTDQLTNGPKLKTARLACGCEELDVKGKSYIVVTSGLEFIDQDHIRTTEVLDRSNVGQGFQEGTIQKFFIKFFFFFLLFFTFQYMAFHCL